MNRSQPLWRQALVLEASPLLVAQVILIRRNLGVVMAASIPAALLLALVHHQLYREQYI